MCHGWFQLHWLWAVSHVKKARITKWKDLSHSGPRNHYLYLTILVLYPTKLSGHSDAKTYILHRVELYLIFIVGKCLENTVTFKLRYIMKWNLKFILFLLFWLNLFEYIIGYVYIICLSRHVFVKHGCPRRQQSLNMAKISKSYILTPPHPQGQVMSEKCEEPIDELTVQVWLLYHQPNFKYCTLFVSGTELQTNRQTNEQTDGRSDY